MQALFLEDTKMDGNEDEIVAESPKSSIAISYSRSVIAFNGTFPGDEACQQYLDNTDWLRENVPGPRQELMFHDDGHTGEEPGPGLMKALEATHRHPPGLFIVQSVFTLSQADKTANTIVEDLVARGWRCIARYERVDTARWTAQRPA
jgi:hypothetical protein